MRFVPEGFAPSAGARGAAPEPARRGAGGSGGLWGGPGGCWGGSAGPVPSRPVLAFAPLLGSFASPPRAARLAAAGGAPGLRRSLLRGRSLGGRGGNGGSGGPRGGAGGRRGAAPLLPCPWGPRGARGSGGGGPPRAESGARRGHRGIPEPRSPGALSPWGGRARPALLPWLHPSSPPSIAASLLPSGAAPAAKLLPVPRRGPRKAAAGPGSEAGSGRGRPAARCGGERRGCAGGVREAAAGGLG